MTLSNKNKNYGGDTKISNVKKCKSIIQINTINQFRKYNIIFIVR